MAIHACYIEFVDVKCYGFRCPKIKKMVHLFMYSRIKTSGW